MLSQSIVLGHLTSYFSIDEPTEEDTRNAYLFAFCKILYPPWSTVCLYACKFVGLVMIAVLVLFLHSHAFLTGERVGMMTRIITTTAIYQKVLTM